MINNKEMYNQNTVKSTLDKLDKGLNPKGDTSIPLSQDEQLALFGIVRNYNILVFGNDMGEPLSLDDEKYRSAYQKMVQELKDKA